MAGPYIASARTVASYSWPETGYGTASALGKKLCDGISDLPAVGVIDRLLETEHLAVGRRRRRDGSKLNMKVVAATASS